jgi:uncharacterized protein YaaQ
VKLVIVILGDGEAEVAVRNLVEAGFRVTRLASSGGFLRRGNTTLLMGMEPEKVDQAFAVVRKTLSGVAEPDRQRATAFVLDTARYEQL